MLNNYNDDRPNLPNEENRSELPNTASPSPENPVSSAPSQDTNPGTHQNEPEQVQIPVHQEKKEEPQNTAPNTSSGTYQNPYEYTYTPYQQPPRPQKIKKKRTLSAGAAIVLCVCTLLLSCASGFFGAYVAIQNMESPVLPTPSVPNDETSDKDPSVIYQSSSSPTDGMSSSGGTSSYYNVANAVKSSVVEITTEFRVNSYFQYITSGAGSGVIITDDGYIITNNHVISDSSASGNGFAETITVRLTSGEEYPARLIGADADSDIAVIKIDVTSLPHAVIGNSDKLGVGEEVVAVGNPLGELGGTVTNGIISALNREIDVDGTTMNLLQTNTAINPGNSGGGLFNMNGELIGIVNAKSSGSAIEGLGFAIPINEAVRVSEELIANGYVTGKPYIGVEFYTVTSTTQALYYNLPGLGIYVTHLEKGLNDKALKVGDRVIAIDEKEINDFSDIASIVKSHEVGDKIMFSVYRSGKLIQVEVTCFEYVPDMSELTETTKKN